MLLSRIGLAIVGIVLLVWLGYGVFDPGIEFVFLWTDVLVYLLVFFVLSFAFYAHGKEHLRAPWRHVLRRRLAMSALVILSAYVFLGLLDSVHFRKALEQQGNETEQYFSGDVLSAFDVLLMEIKNRQEKTYSAPFATHLFAKEMIETNGGKIRDYPPLRYGGAHLNNPMADKSADIARSVALAIVETIVISLLLALLIAYDLARRDKQAVSVVIKSMVQGRTDIPWREILMAFAFICLIVCLIANLGRDYHVLGTDKVGQDVLYLSLKSIRTGLVIGTLTTLVMLPFAVLLGIMAGYFKSWVDDIIQFLYTTLSSIPGVLLIAAAVLSMQVYIANHPEMFETVTERADLRLLFLCVILGITSWTSLCRLLRGEALKLSQLDYITAAQAFGVGNLKVITRHILPNVMHIVLIAVVLDFSGLVLAEAVLSYVGVGVDPIMISWGNMINSARLEMAREPIVWWSLVAAFFFMFLLVLAANLFSDAVRDAFDPRLTRAR